MNDVAARFAPAKINLYLHVIGQRPDGYHNLDSLVVFANVGDGLEARAANELTLEVDGPFAAAVPSGGDNLVLKAARALAALAKVPACAELRLTKHLPVAAGMGGGSADAAATLRALCDLWDVRAPEADLARLALSLGADVPVCLRGRPAWLGGVGDDLAPAPLLPPAWLVLVNPGVEVPTQGVFKGRAGAFSAPARFADAPADVGALAAALGERRNDLTAAAATLAPVIAETLDLLEKLPGVLLARMTGSGASCFALCGDAAVAEAVAARVTEAHPDWWTVAAALRNGQ